MYFKRFLTAPLASAAPLATAISAFAHPGFADDSPLPCQSVGSMPPGSEWTQYPRGDCYFTQADSSSWSRSIGDSSTEGILCTQPGLVTSVKCADSYCGSLSIKCSTADLQGDPDVNDSTYYQWFPTSVSEENFDDGQGFARCQPGTFLVGLHCEGKHCDNLQNACAPLAPPPYPETMSVPGNCSGNTPWISEEANNGASATSITVPQGQVIDGWSCKGSYCDDIQFEYCLPYAGTIPVAGYWAFVGSLTTDDGFLRYEITTGRQETNSTSYTGSLNISAGVSTGVEGVVDVNASVNTGLSEQITAANNYSETSAITAQCQVDGGGGQKYMELWQFYMANGNPAVIFQTSNYFCSVFDEGTQPPDSTPLCAPDYCSGDNCLDSCLPDSDGNPVAQLTPLPKGASALYVSGAQY